MKYRALKDKITGKYLNVLFSTAGEEFSVPVESHINDISTAMNIAFSSLEAIEADVDPRSGDLIFLPF